MASASTSSLWPRHPLVIAICSYCEATGHYYKSCPKLKKKKEMEEKDGKKPKRPTYPPSDTCGKKNHSTERCWQGSRAHLRPKRTQTGDKDTNASKTEESLKGPTTQKLLIQANLMLKILIQKTNFATTPNT